MSHVINGNSDGRKVALHGDYLPLPVDSESELDEEWISWKATRPEPNGESRRENRSAYEVFAGCVRSKPFENFTLCVIVINTVVMALEADNPDESYWDQVDDGFLLFYVCEMACRLIVERWSFFTSANKGWNIFELVLVIVGLIDQWLLPLVFAGHANSSQSSEVVMSSRVGKLMRMSWVLRTVRIFNKFEQMRWVLLGLIRSAASVFWIAVFLFILILVYAILIRNVIKDTDDFWELIEENDGEEMRESMEENFGTVLACMDTLFTWLTFDDWSEEARSINVIFWWMEFIWISYFMLGSFTFLSLITGIAADKMNEVRQEEFDGDNASRIAQIVEQLDEDDDSLLDIQEFSLLLQRPEVQATLQECDIFIDGEDEVTALFAALNKDHDSSTLSWEELTGLLQIMATDKIGRHLTYLEGTILRICTLLPRNPSGAGEWMREISSVYMRAQAVNTRVMLLESSLQDLFSMYGYQPPS